MLNGFLGEMETTIRLAGLVKSADESNQDVTIGTYLEKVAQLRRNCESHEVYYGSPTMFDKDEFNDILSLEDDELSVGTLLIVK